MSYQGYNYSGGRVLDSVGALKLASGSGVKLAPGALAKAVLRLSEVERKAAEKAASVSRGQTTAGLVAAIVEAINAVRSGNPVGTLRQSGTKYAFAYAPGKWLLIDTDGAAPAYKTVTPESAPEIASWTQRYGGDV